MDQVAGSGEILHDSPRNNEILSLLCNFISPSGDFRSSVASTQAGIAGPSSSTGGKVVVAANISDSHQHTQQDQPQLVSFVQVLMGACVLKLRV